MINDELSAIEMTERLLELELALERDRWVQLGNSPNSQNEFSREGLRIITEFARLYYIKNPLIKRGINVSSYYVFGRGVNIVAKDDEINSVIQAFFDDPHNQRILFSPRARKAKDKELSVDGNIFIALFVHPTTGFIRVGTIPFDEMSDVVRDPESNERILYYLRTWRAVDNVDSTTEVQHKMYYRDLLNGDIVKTNVRGIPVNQICVLYQVKINAFSNWAFGISEAYAAKDWAEAYKGFLTDYVKIIKSLARFAWRKKVSGGSAGVQAAKLRLNSTFAQQGASTLESNPSPVAGAVAIETGSDQLDPIKTQGATTSASEGKPIKLMVAAAFGLPDTFFGDTDTGNLATAKSLDRPTEFQFVDRQELWVGIYKALIDYVLFNAVAAPSGALNGLGELTENEYGEVIVSFPEGVNTNVTVDFPPILEDDTLQNIQALVTGSTFDGKIPSIIPDKKFLAKQMLIRLGIDDIDELIDEWYGDGNESLLLANDPAMQQVNESLRELLEVMKNPTSG